MITSFPWPVYCGSLVCFVTPQPDWATPIPCSATKPPCFADTRHSLVGNRNRVLLDGSLAPIDRPSSSKPQRLFHILNHLADPLDRGFDLDHVSRDRHVVG